MLLNEQIELLILQKKKYRTKFQSHFIPQLIKVSSRDLALALLSFHQSQENQTTQTT